MSTATEQAFEALCSAFYMSPSTEFLGERDVEGEHCAYFHFGEKPKDMRVTVARSDLEEVRVRVEWRNYAADARNPIKGEQRLVVRTYAAAQADLEAATSKAVETVLNIYLDVLNEEGVAGTIALLAPEVEDEDES